MPLEGYAASIASSTTAGPSLFGSTSETSLLPSEAKRTVPAYMARYAGQHWRLTAAGRISTVVTTPGTMTLRLKMGSAAVLASQAFALNIVSKTSVTWYLDLLITIRSVGSAATMMGNGLWHSEAVIGSPTPSVGGAGVHAWQAVTPVVGATFDSTIANIVDFTGQWSVNSGSNGILTENFQLVSVD